MINIQRGEHVLGDFVKQTFNIGLYLDAFELISFKLMYIQPNILMLGWMTLTSGSQGNEKAGISAIILL